jgi:hypothetical protein
VSDEFFTLGEPLVYQATACPCCGHRLDGMSQVLGVNEDGVGLASGPPTEGTVSICMACAGVALFTATGGLRQPTNVEREALDKTRAVANARVAIIMAHYNS